MRRSSSSTRRWIVILAASLLTPSTAATEPYAPPSREELRAWAEENPEAALDAIQAWDEAEHAVPVVPAPHYAVMVTGTTVWLVPLGSTEIRIGRLVYEFTWDPVEYPDVLPEPDPWAWVWPAAIGGAVGIALTIIAVVFVR